MREISEAKSHFEQLRKLAYHVLGATEPVDPKRFQKYLPVLWRLHADLNKIAETATVDHTWLELLGELKEAAGRANGVFYLTQMFREPVLPLNNISQVRTPTNNIPCYQLYRQLTTFYSSIGHGLPYEYIFGDPGYVWKEHMENILQDPDYYVELRAHAGQIS